MNFKHIKTAIISIVATISSYSFSQDLIARQAPIDGKLKSVESLTLQQLLKEEWELKDQTLSFSDLYPNWDNKYVNSYGRDVVIPETYVIDLTGFCMPTIHTKINSPFGPRKRKMHSGLDIKVSIGDTIVAAFDGKVRIVKTERRGYGKYIVIRHYNGLETVYGHLSEQLVKENQEVRTGEVIGLGGNTGRSTGSHLHFETRFLGIALDPALMFNFPEQDIVADSYVFVRNGANKGGMKDGMAGDNTIRYYKVKQGDSLSEIAVKQGISVDILCKLNRISTKTILRPGQILRCS
ncbi:Murein hydrolase activator NlpD [termite gut metagenome]|uniref:Murein hydrolase activator NlpD n=1 Tax=termite gut metagenome TaxID=433724 RepID=A0A5J4S229_9ZZZZ